MTIERPFHNLLGLELVSAGDGKAVMAMKADPRFGNSRGVVHGGAIFTLLDAACSAAVRSSAADIGAATISLTITYMLPAQGNLTGHGLVLRAGRSVVAVEGEARDEQGALVAKAFGTFKVFAKKS